MLTRIRSNDTGGPVKGLLIVLACTSALAVAGCGGGGGGGSEPPLSKADYEQQMQALQTKLSSSAAEFQSAFSDPTDLAAVADGLTRTADVLDDTSASLDAISPPEDVADAHQTMADKSAAAADKIRELADKVKNGSLADLQSSLQDFQNITEFTELAAAVAEIQSKGYDIGGS